MSELLFERDYNDVAKILEDYRKGEIQKKLDEEMNPEKQVELMMEQAEKRRIFAQKRGKKRFCRKKQRISESDNVLFY